jgi:uncharacterized protein (DUF433 family)
MSQGNFDYRQYLSRDKRIMGGETVFKGTRVLLRTILASLADGDSPETLLKSFPTLTPDHLRAAIAFAAASAREDIPRVELPDAA